MYQIFIYQTKNSYNFQIFLFLHEFSIQKLKKKVNIRKFRKKKNFTPLGDSILLYYIILLLINRL